MHTTYGLWHVDYTALLNGKGLGMGTRGQDYAADESGFSGITDLV